MASKQVFFAYTNIPTCYWVYFGVSFQSSRFCDTGILRYCWLSTILYEFVSFQAISMSGVGGLCGLSNRYILSFCRSRVFRYFVCKLGVPTAFTLGSMEVCVLGATSGFSQASIFRLPVCARWALCSFAVA